MESFERYVGQTLDGRYIIDRVVGIGGMAVVFRATDTVSRRTVAIKMLKDDVARDEAAVRRFINESKAVAMLSHPNIVSIYDVSVSGELKYIVMEYIEGVTLKSYMAQKGALPLGETISIAEQILRALIHAHSRGIVHRDIKPQNIMLLKNGVIKVADFGIAKLPNAETVTMTDHAIGTVYYISPEQASGLPIDARSDIYSTGVLLYEMASGRLPFVADSPVSVALMQVQDEPAPPTSVNPAIPRGLEQIILTAMEKSPKNRFQTAEQMYRWVETLKAKPDFVFKPLSAPLEQNTEGGEEKKSDKPRKRRKTNIFDISMFPVILGVAFAFLFACIISAYYLWTEVLFNEERDRSFVITVDNFVGTEYYIGMEEDLAEDNYNVYLDFVYDSEMPTGTIIAQDPVSGEKRRVETGKLRCDLHLTVSRGVESFPLPDILMQDHRTVTDTLSKVYGIVSVEVEEYNTAVSEGLVYRTDPAVGATVNVGDTVTLYVSRGPQIANVIVPDFYGMSERAALVEIQKNNLAVGSVSYEYAEEAAGTVIRQSRIRYTLVAEGTAIDFVVSLGPANLPVPNLYGMTEQQAAEELTRNGFALGSVTYENSAEAAGTVIRQDPAYPATAAKDTAVNIVVSLGAGTPPETEPSETDAPETDTPPEEGGTPEP